MYSPNNNAKYNCNLETMTWKYETLAWLEHLPEAISARGKYPTLFNVIEISEKLIERYIQIMYEYYRKSRNRTNPENAIRLAITNKAK